jgi:cell division protein FtsZ
VQPVEAVAPEPVEQDVAASEGERLVLDPPVAEAAQAPAAPEADELVLDNQSILDERVSPNPLPPVYDDLAPVAETTAEPRRWLMPEEPQAAKPAPAVAAPAGATLFERMSNIARGAAKADQDAAPSSDPLDIPRFLNRQNNQ